MAAHHATQAAQQPIATARPTPIPYTNTSPSAQAQYQAQAASPPTKQALRSWWGKFKKSSEMKQDLPVPEPPSGIFGVPLRQSITYANVAISLIDAEGKSYIYGYVPIIVAKCGVYLKEKATNVEGIFRLSGSEKRIKELRAIFDSPERYGKGLDWDGYTVHDAANVLRRYLNQLPEPIVPLDLYERFRVPLRGQAFQAVGDQQETSRIQDQLDLEETIKQYQQLITELPPLNIQLLLYILDLLAVFASKADENRMTSQNLAAIFQPGLLSHPQHDMAPEEYRLSQDVIVFLIENQDHFLIGMRGTAADQKTMQDVQNGTPPPSAPTTPVPGRGKNSIGRSASNASAGADSVRRGGGIRRNVSVNSRHSRQSNGAPSPASPSYGGTPLGHSSSGGVHRSNTVPSKKSPGLPNRLQKGSEARFPSGSGSPFASLNEAGPTTPVGVTSPIQESVATSASPYPSPALAPSAMRSDSLAPSSYDTLAERSSERLLDTTESKAEVPQKERGFPSIFNRSTTAESDRKQPNKLRKKRIPGSSNPSAQSSRDSLHGGVSPNMAAADGTSDIPERSVLETIPSQNPILQHTDASPQIPQQDEQPILDDAGAHLRSRPDFSHHSSDGTLKPNADGTLKPQPSSNSLRSGDASATDQSDIEQHEDPLMMAEQKEKRRRWRLSRKREDSIASATHFGSPKRTNAPEMSTTSLSSSKPRKSFTGETAPSFANSDATMLHTNERQTSTTGHDITGLREKEEKKGPIGWIKDKMREAEEKKRARETEREMQSGERKAGSESSASNAALPLRGKSMDVKREVSGSEQFASGVVGGAAAPPVTSEAAANNIVEPVQAPHAAAPAIAATPAAPTVITTTQQ